jgi:hypothetical protein
MSGNNQTKEQGKPFNKIGNEWTIGLGAEHVVVWLSTFAFDCFGCGNDTYCLSET